MTVLVKLSVVKLVTREEDFKGGAQALNLKLAPQPTLVTTNTVHDTGDIPKVKLELFL